MKLKVILFTILAAVLLAACNAEQDNSSNSADDTNIKTLVQEYSEGTISNETASITSTQLIIEDNKSKEERVYELPEEEFFVSIAPFINETHPCTNHSLTGCQGEMANKDFDVHIEDVDGNLIIEETMNSGENGFVDLWLPRDKTFHVTFTLDGKEAESEISTFENDGTCITTMQLS